MPIRNPFRRAPGAEALDDGQRDAAERGFQNTAIGGPRPIEIKEPTEYKLSGKSPWNAPHEPFGQRGSHACEPALTGRLEISDSGVYLPVRPMNLVFVSASTEDHT